jgi:hypothetical protein
MSAGDFGKRLSAQDASFLYFEKAEAPLHIGSIAVIEGDVSYDRFVDSIEKRLHLIPRYLQCVVPAPFNIGHPTWEWDTNFDARRHILEVQIESPGTDAQAIDLAAKLFAGMLGRTSRSGDVSRKASRKPLRHCVQGPPLPGGWCIGDRIADARLRRHSQSPAADART